jgi:hypothetical protein
MENIRTEKELQAHIEKLQNKWQEEGAEIKKEFFVMYENFHPLSFLTKSVGELVSSGKGKGKSNLLNTTLGVTVGYLAKMFFVNASRNPVKKVVGTILMVGISNVVNRHPEILRTIRGFISGLRKEKQEKQEKQEQSEAQVSEV